MKRKHSLTHLRTDPNEICVVVVVIVVVVVVIVITMFERSICFERLDSEP